MLARSRHLHQPAAGLCRRHVTLAVGGIARSRVITNRTVEESPHAQVRLEPQIRSFAASMPPPLPAVHYKGPCREPSASMRTSSERYLRWKIIRTSRKRESRPRFYNLQMLVEELLQDLKQYESPGWHSCPAYGFVAILQAIL